MQMVSKCIILTHIFASGESHLYTHLNLKPTILSHFRALYRFFHLLGTLFPGSAQVSFRIVQISIQRRAPPHHLTLHYLQMALSGFEILVYVFIYMLISVSFQLESQFIKARTSVLFTSIYLDHYKHINDYNRNIVLTTEIQSSILRNTMDIVGNQKLFSMNSTTFPKYDQTKLITYIQV